MIIVETYIKKDKPITSVEHINENYLNYFVHCNDESCLDYITDYDYLEGAIIISCDGIGILDFRYWDLVDQLWSYIIEAIYGLSRGENQVQFYFPDQPIKVNIQKISKYALLLKVEGKTFSFNKQEFICALLNGAEMFFSTLAKCQDTYLVTQSKEKLDLIKKIKNEI